MRTVGLKALHDDLETYVRAAEAGETVVVFDGALAVARLVPANDAAPVSIDDPMLPPPSLAASSVGISPIKPNETEEEFLARGAREGWLTPAKVAPGTAMPAPPKAIMTMDELMNDLDEARADRW